MLQKRPKNIGVTGGIGTGKTLVCNIFSELGAPVYNSDVEAKKIICENKAVIKSIKELLGEEAYQNNGSYNVGFVKTKVLNQQSLLEQLNNIVHPAVALHYKEWLNQQTFPYVVKESALLLKQSIEDFYKVIYCTVTNTERFKRIQKRDPERSLSEINKILEQQDFSVPKSDKILTLNNNSNSPILETILNWHKGFLN